MLDIILFGMYNIIIAIQCKFYILGGADFDPAAL